MKAVDDRHPALIVVDVQNDFCPGGALAVTDGDAIVPLVNRLMAALPRVVLTQDWHPNGHLSFASSHPGKVPFEVIQMAYGKQILWPDHCIQGSRGAAFHKDLNTDEAGLVVRKGYRREIDSYSAFFENDGSTPTGLAGALREYGLDHICLAGLATDFCVAWSALDARRLDFEVTVIEDACRGIDVDGSMAEMRARMSEAGVLFAQSEDVLKRAS